MSRPKAKGTAAETAVVRWLRDHGFPFAERRALHDRDDRGDVAGIPGVTLEIKACRRLELSTWIDEASTEATNANTSIYAVVHKRRGKGDPGDWYVTLPLAVFAELML